MVKERINENALNYLTQKQQRKGKEIIYKRIELADYLQPYNKLSIEEKRKIFELRNKMTQIPNNFLNKGQKVKCICGEDEEMSHVYKCTILNSNKILKIEYEEIYKKNPLKQIEVLRIFERKSLQNTKT